MPLLENKHLGVLPQEKTESPSGQISQLQIHQLLSTRPLVMFPMELNGGDQAVNINLPGSLHAGSSVTSDEHPYIEVDIPPPTTEEKGSTALPQGRQHYILAVTIPKTPWKPRITLMVEVNELIDRGMTNNYDQESEHSVAADHATQVETSPPLKMEGSLLPLETSSQTSVEGTEASVESNLADTTLVTVAHSSWNDSPIADLQLEVHLAINSMFTAKRSSELKMQCTIRDFETSLCQHEVEAIATNKKAKVAHSRRDLQARVKCAKAIMRAKFEYLVAVQEARVVQCAELEESKATYSEALSKTAAKKSLKCTTLHRVHAEHMQDLEAQALQAENISHQDFLLMHQAILHEALHSLKEDLYLSYSLLLGPSSPSLQQTPFTPAPQAKGNPPSAITTKPKPEWSPLPKR